MTNVAPPQPPLAPTGAPLPNGKAKRPFYKRKLVWLLGVIVLIAIIVAVNQDNGSSTTSAPAGTPAPSAAEAPAAPVSEAPAAKPAASDPGIGTSVRDGKFEFVVTSIEPGVAEIGSAPISTKAQGQFILVNVNVKNISNEAQPFDGGSAKAFDSQGRQFTSSSSAAIYLPDSNSFFTPINPGNSVDSKVVFDVPADAQLTSIELHDSMFSEGVTVKL